MSDTVRGPVIHASAALVATAVALYVYGWADPEGDALFLAAGSNIVLVVAGAPLTLVTMAFGLDETQSDTVITLAWGACGVAMAGVHLGVRRWWAARTQRH